MRRSRSVRRNVRRSKVRRRSVRRRSVRRKRDTKYKRNTRRKSTRRNRRSRRNRRNRISRRSRREKRSINQYRKKGGGPSSDLTEQLTGTVNKPSAIRKAKVTAKAVKNLLSSGNTDDSGSDKTSKYLDVSDSEAVKPGQVDEREGRDYRIYDKPPPFTTNWTEAVKEAVEKKEEKAGKNLNKKYDEFEDV